MPNVQVRHDSVRGCGTRKPGGLYLVSAGTGFPCGRLPVPLERCPTCDHGIKPTRGWTWVDAGELLSKRNCAAPATQCAGCPTITGKHGLIWIGEQFYPTPQHWLREAGDQGVSRRIKAIPKDFVLGETWVLVAHRKAIPAPSCAKVYDLTGDACRRREAHEGACGPEWEYIPGIFQAFKPTAVEYVTRGDETDEELEQLEKRGITPVKVYVDGELVGGTEEDEDESD